MKPLNLALLSIILSVAAQFFLKAGMTSSSVKQALLAPSLNNVVAEILFNRLVMSGFLLYGLGAVMWLGVLSKWEVSKAYPLVGAGFVVTAMVGWLLGEELSPVRVAGVLLICAGVFLVAKS